jgi:hypothetical protein
VFTKNWGSLQSKLAPVGLTGWPGNSASSVALGILGAWAEFQHCKRGMCVL